jgi:hypothetical protein
MHVTSLSQFNSHELRFHFEQQNTPLPEAVFQLPPGAEIGAKPVSYRAYWRDANHRPFLRTSDGSDGDIRGKEGWQGEKDELGSGGG